MAPERDTFDSLVLRALRTPGRAHLRPAIEKEQELPTLVHGREFAAQMRRFLPNEVHERTLARPEFLDVTTRELHAMLLGGGAVDGRTP